MKIILNNKISRIYHWKLNKENNELLFDEKKQMQMEGQWYRKE